MNNDFFASGSRSLDLWSKLADLVGRLFTVNQVVTAQAVFSSVLDSGNEIAFLPEDQWRSNVVVISWADGVCILLSGTNGTIHLPNLFRAWSGQIAPPVIAGSNAAFSQAALSIEENFSQEFWWARTNVWIVGHSYGGGVATILASILKNRYPSSKVTCLTMGAPRPGNGEVNRMLRGVDLLRAWFLDDPVAGIPPHGEEAPAIHAFAPTSLRAGSNDQVQQPFGFTISDPGVIQWQETASRKSTDVSYDVMAWCFGLHGFRSLNHSISRYAAAFSNGARFSYQFPSQTIRARLEDDEPNTRIQRREVEQQAEVFIMQAIQTNTMPPVNLTPQVFNPGTVQRYRRKKTAAGWVVVFGADVVEFAGSKRQAGKRARAYNQATASWRSNNARQPA